MLLVKGTVFVSVVDPGVGSDRASVVAKTTQSHYVVTPDNGTLTHLHKTIGLESVRIIDEEKTVYRDQAIHILSMDAIFMLSQEHV